MSMGIIEIIVMEVGQGLAWKQEGKEVEVEITHDADRENICYVNYFHIIQIIF